MNLSTNEITVIGIDHGYGNIKTAHSCFKTGVAVYDKEPTFKNNLLIYDGKYYIIGEEHKEFKSDKMADEDYYVLTLAAIARELKVRNKTFATVHIAAGLPMTWVGEQKEEFKKYLLQKNLLISVFAMLTITLILRVQTYSLKALPLFPTSYIASKEQICLRILATAR